MFISLALWATVLLAVDICKTCYRPSCDTDIHKQGLSPPSQFLLCELFHAADTYKIVLWHYHKFQTCFLFPLRVVAGRR